MAVHAKTEPTANSKNKKEAKVSEAFCEGELFRGFETILTGRDPLDAQQITQRICGVCPTPHGIASVQAQEMAYGIKPTHNGRLLQNLILAANYMASHIVHFYQLSALDFVDIKALLEYKGKDRVLLGLKQWVETAIARKDVFRRHRSCRLRSQLHQEPGSERIAHRPLCAGFGSPQDSRRDGGGVCRPRAALDGPGSGGVTQVPSMERILSYRARLQKVMAFAENVYVPDLLEVAKAFPQSWRSAAAATISCRTACSRWTTTAIGSSGRGGDRRQMGGPGSREHP